MTKDIKYLQFAAMGARLFSTCSRRQYMAVVVDSEGTVIGTGYNGPPSGMKHCVDGGCPRGLDPNQKSGGSYDNCFANHAEQNALLRSNRSQRIGGTIYVNGTCCFTCAKLIAGSGIAKLVMLLDDPREWTESERFLTSAGIQIVCFKPGDIFGNDCESYSSNKKDGEGSKKDGQEGS